MNSHIYTFVEVYSTALKSVASRDCRKLREAITALSWLGGSDGLSLRVRDPPLGKLSRETELASDTCGKRRSGKSPLNEKRKKALLKVGEKQRKRTHKSLKKLQHQKRACATR
ncbi:uncharacterized protein LOC108033793 [Drosophila biarmipes]|uniref:uncharacterized protein LOC108033793 n=1 Tax=Drosophila biarmipes TaxID=125945 RepID=UPI0007E8523D|nr:uncharacterized protein LOC108033793 [Drosophila biarmipes]